LQYADAEPDIGRPAASSLAISFRNVCKSFGDLEVLRNLSFDVPTGEKLVIIGPSGCGKTTLLRMLMTLEHPTSGTIEVFGELLGLRRAGDALVADTPSHIRQVRANVGMVFQQFNLFPHMTALDNVVEAPIRVQRASKAEAQGRGRELLEMVGVTDKADCYPRQLSGGQQQRVAIARALAMQPRIMLFDEITSALDPELVGEVLKVVRRLARESGMTMLIVTHEMRFASDIADRVVFLEGGEIVEDAPPAAIFSNPSNPRTREFLHAVLER